jgi:hypothetical protein
MTGALDELRHYLNGLPAGKVEDKEELVHVLAACWNRFRGAGFQGMTSGKLFRLENATWNPPELSFLLERHGGTVLGSTRAVLQRWTVNLDRGTAHCDSYHGYRQLQKRATPIRTAPLVDEIVALILSGTDDWRLKWFPDRSMVRVYLSYFIGGEFKQTRTGRRKRFRIALDHKPLSAGWQNVPGKLDTHQHNDSPPV